MKINLETLPREIRFIIHSKAYEFQKEGIQKIESEDIIDYLYKIKWKDKEELDLCELVDDIMSLSFSQVFDYLRVRVITEASNKRLTDFNDLIFR